MHHLIKVDGHPNLVRDRKTGAIININNEEIEKQKLARAKKKQEMAELEQLKSDMKDIKALLSKLVEKL